MLGHLVALSWYAIAALTAAFIIAGRLEQTLIRLRATTGLFFLSLQRLLAALVGLLILLLMLLLFAAGFLFELL